MWCEPHLAMGGGKLPIDSLITLATLRGLKRLTTDELAIHFQREPALAQAHEATRGRTYMLAAGVYQADGDQATYTRQMGFSNLQHEQLVLNYCNTCDRGGQVTGCKYLSNWGVAVGPDANSEPKKRVTSLSL